MAKDLPYFKFFVSEWNDGDITLENYEVQGLFVNICSYYWSNECNVSFKKTMKKFKDADYDLFKSLIDSDIIKVVDDELIITFLDEQQGERKQVSERNSKNGKISAEKRKLKQLEQQQFNDNPTTVEKSLNDNPTNKRREEKKREENKRNTTAENINFSDLLGFINSTLGKSYKVINSTVKQKYNARLKDGYVKKDFMTAIVNASKDKYHKETNYKYLTVEYFARIKTLDLHCEEIKVKTKKGIHI